MRIRTYLILTTLVVLTTSTNSSCKSEASKNVKDAPMVQPAQPAVKQFAADIMTGTVVETMNASSYTYVQFDTGSKKIWAAAPTFQVKIGDKVNVPMGALMKNYQSKTLNRTFEEVYFVGAITVGDAKLPASQMSGGHGGTAGKAAAPAPVKIDFTGIKKPKGGKTVAELYAEKSSLSGKEVTVRGKVVKFSTNIMGKNWIHLQDGTGAEGSNDLTITTDSSAKVGDTVVASGVFAVNKDLGYGYKYDIIVEDANIKIE
jgi:hypothetical protein